jgi:hypothetical protein
MLAAKPLITNAKRPRQSLVHVANLTRGRRRDGGFVARRFGVFNASLFDPVAAFVKADAAPFYNAKLVANVS